MKGLLGVVVAPAGNENQRPGVPHEAGVNGGLNAICVEAFLSSSISVSPAALAVQGAVTSPASPASPASLTLLLLEVLLDPPSALPLEPLLERALLVPLLLERVLDPLRLLERVLLEPLTVPPPPFDEQADAKPRAVTQATAASAERRPLDMRVDLSRE